MRVNRRDDRSFAAAGISVIAAPALDHASRCPAMIGTVFYTRAGSRFATWLARLVYGLMAGRGFFLWSDPDDAAVQSLADPDGAASDVFGR